MSVSASIYPSTASTSFLKYLGGKKVPLALSTLIGVGITAHALYKIRQFDKLRLVKDPTRYTIFAVAGVVATVAFTCLSAAHSSSSMAAIGGVSLVFQLLSMRQQRWDNHDRFIRPRAEYTSAVNQAYAGLVMTALPLVGVGITYARFIQLQKDVSTICLK